MTVDDLIERYRAAAGGDRDRWAQAGRELLLSRDPVAIGEWLCSPKRFHFQTGPGGRSGGLDALLIALAVRGGRGIAFPFDNPWDISPQADVGQVIEQVWAPLADTAADVVDRLMEQAFAVAMVSYPGGDCLAYLLRSELLGAQVCWGGSPSPWAQGARISPGLRRLAGVHGSLYFTNLEGRIDPGRMAPSGRLVVFAGHRDGDSCLDLHRVDESGDPLVVSHDRNDGERFWDWFNREVRFYLTG